MRGIKSRKTKIKALIITIFVVLSTFGMSIYARKNVTPVILAMAESAIQSQTVNAVNSAAHIIIAEDMDYSELVDVSYDKDGNIRLIQPNSVKLNRLARDLQNLSQNNVEMIADQYVYIPVGAFTGSILLSGVGPDVPVRMLPIGSVVSNYFTVFENVGINQTRHSIYINVRADVSLVLPISGNAVSTEVAVLVCESIIIGNIPNVYVNGDGAVDYLDLIG